MPKLDSHNKHLWEPRIPIIGTKTVLRPQKPRIITRGADFEALGERYKNKTEFIN